MVLKEEVAIVGVGEKFLKIGIFWSLSINNTIKTDWI